MNVELIEKKTFEKLKQKLHRLFEAAKGLQPPDQQPAWLDNQDVCFKLNIGLRTLQSYRDRGKIPYSMIEHKCYYKLSDVETFMEKLRIERINNKK